MSTTETATVEESTLPANPNNPQLAKEVRRLKGLVEGKLGSTAPHLESLRAEIAELQKTSKRHPTIGRQLTLLHARVNAMLPKMERYDKVLKGLDIDNAGTMTLKLNKQELEAMLADSESFDTLVTEIGGVKTKLEELETKVDGNHVAVNARIDETNGTVSRLTHRVFNLESASTRIVLATLIVGIAVVIIAWLVLLPQVFMTSDIKLDDGTMIPGVPDPLSNSWGWKLGLALSLGAIAAGVTYFIGALVSSVARRRAARKATAPQEQVTVPVPRPANPVNSPIVEDATPTLAYDRTPTGAASGTH